MTDDLYTMIEVLMAERRQEPASASYMICISAEEGPGEPGDVMSECFDCGESIRCPPDLPPEVQKFCGDCGLAEWVLGGSTIRICIDRLQRVANGLGISLREFVESLQPIH